MLCCIGCFIWCTLILKLIWGRNEDNVKHVLYLRTILILLMHNKIEYETSRYFIIIPFNFKFWKHFISGLMGNFWPSCVLYGALFMASVLWLGCELYLISTIALFRKYKVEESLKKINFHLCEELASLTHCVYLQIFQLGNLTKIDCWSNPLMDWFLFLNGLTTFDNTSYPNIVLDQCSYLFYSLRVSPFPLWPFLCITYHRGDPIYSLQ